LLQADYKPEPLPKLEPLPGEIWQLSDFEVGPILGTGSFGRVSLAKHKQTGSLVAIKCLSKAHIIKNQQVNLT
jgi:serine/threonine protein kinase